MLGKKINGVEGSVTDLGIELDAAKEQISLYVNKVGELESSVSKLEIGVEGIRTTVASVQGTAADAKNLANAAQSAANDAASKALAAQTTADSANSKADANATAIAQTESSISLLAGAFVKQPDGSYKLTTVAGSLVAASVNESVASLYAKKDDVSAELAVRVKFDPDTKKITSSIKLSADQIDMSANDYISIINQGTTTISASRVDLKGKVTFSMLDSDAQDTIDSKVTQSAVDQSINTFKGTIIEGGKIKTELLEVTEIYATKGTVGGLTIESDKIVGKGTNGEMILSADIDGGYPGLTWKSGEQTLIGLQTHLLNGYKSSVLRLADNASEQSMLTPGYMDIDGKGGEIIINTTLSNEVTISINKSYKVNNVPMSYKMALGMDSNGIVRIGGQKWARSASEVKVGELWVDGDNYVKVRMS